MPGQSLKDKQRVNLFASSGVAIPDLVIEPGENLAMVERESADEKFVRLVRGGLSRNAASQQTWARAYAGDLVARGKRLLGEE